MCYKEINNLYTKLSCEGELCVVLMSVDIWPVAKVRGRLH